MYILVDMCKYGLRDISTNGLYPEHFKIIGNNHMDVFRGIIMTIGQYQLPRSMEIWSKI